MTDTDLPETRQALLADRLAHGVTLRLSEIAAEFGVSTDTARRDLATLEAAGQARRVRGGALPAAPASPLRDREPSDLPPGLLDRLVRHLAQAHTLIVDGGTSTLALARRLDPAPGRVVITPAPRIAAVTHSRGIATITIGGPLSERGGIATGAAAQAALADTFADVTVLGACGLDANRGLSSDDHDEAAIKRAMAAAAARTCVLTGAAKLGRRARHATLRSEAIHLLATDAPPDATAPFAARGTEIL